uniref:Uncharacterized protein n=1 Tax=Candidatus Kentrum sp. UNK TaxID=2126344 RepID=A0A451AR52_9GAMM|nr:MAG: hypothetical protein BECKUNK1418G_GA0071005_12392 [Candidatus Kentron sp. UNK]
MKRVPITPADEKRARVGWIAPRIHREEEMVDARSDPPYGPESGLLFHSKERSLYTIANHKVLFGSGLAGLVR